ncbi:MAG: flagellar basal body-associated FliL family protein [Oleiphilaceae bacterium]|nr:flagellar basal body-associated FliL family protein [Oleiphilaceae bacterium]
MMSLPKCLIYSFFALFLGPALAFAQEDAADEPQAEEATEEPAEEQGDTAYLSLTPSFVTHVGEPGSKLTYLKAEISLRTASSAVLEAAEKHMPRLRHELVTLLGDQTDLDVLTSNEGQRVLREQARERINSVLEEEQTDVQIDDVLFTSFVVQR